MLHEISLAIFTRFGRRAEVAARVECDMITEDVEIWGGRRGSVVRGRHREMDN